MEVNLGGVINGVMTILPRILNTGRAGILFPRPLPTASPPTGLGATYCTTKFAVAGMMEAIATELQDKGVGCFRADTRAERYQPGEDLF